MAVQKGDPVALERLWEQVKDYAYTLVMRYKTKPYAETEDYLQTAFLGVRAAALAFDPSRGSFLTVADWYIRNACRTFYCWHRRGEIKTISYDVPFNPENPSDGDYKDVFPDTSLPDSSERLEQAEMIRDVRAAVNDLSPRGQDVIKQHYYQGKPLDAISAEQGVSRERIRQIERKALEKMRRSKYLVPYRRLCAPHGSVGVGAFRRFGGSVVEYTAIKNADAELKALRAAQKREYLDYVRRVMDAVSKGRFSLETGWIMVENYRAERGML